MRANPVPSILTEHGLCARVSGPDFFSPLPHHVREAKIVCSMCPVRLQCLNWALQRPETYGVWGGADQWEIRTACAVTPSGEPAKKPHRAKCPYCRSTRHVTEIRDDNSRSSTATCGQCGLVWKRAKSYVRKGRSPRNRSEDALVA